jgi:isocitrate/isopropylmalate dehydrogenase
VAAVLAEGKSLPRDLGGQSSTEEVTDAVLEKIG